MVVLTKEKIDRPVGEDVPFAKVATGGINEQNIKFYVSTGVNIVVLTCVYFGKPADIKIRIKPC